MPATQRLVSWLLAIVAVIVILWAILGARADAATACFSFETVRSKLAGLGQEITYTAVSPNGTSMFIAVDPATGRWSMFTQPTADMTCLLMVGKAWHDAPERIRHPPSY